MLVMVFVVVVVVAVAVVVEEVVMVCLQQYTCHQICSHTFCTVYLHS